ncbi:AAA family ATPase [Devosia sp. 919]|uniref:AAA family ATPase n=1 Tax=Devosia sp. 919 TaxID=2726065 RepID=UPI00155369A6
MTWDNGKSNPGRGDMWACCPFHAENSPSFHADAQKGTYHCFGCGKSGDHFAFLSELIGMGFPEAVETVARMAGISLPDGPSGPHERQPPEQPRVTRTLPQPSAGEIKPEIVKTYDYTDRDGALLYQVCRLQRKLPDGTWAKNKDGKGTWKTFLQRRPDGAGKWIWSLAAGEFMRRTGGDWRIYDSKKFSEGMETRFFESGGDHTIYRHPAVEIAIAAGEPVLIVEGEKDADTAVDLGFCGTTNSSGSKHWTDAHAACFRDADVVICLDNDEAGARADTLAKSLKGIARRVRVLDFAQVIPGFTHKGDITDWVEQFGGSAEQFVQILRTLPDYRPKPPVSTFGAQTSGTIAKKPVVYDWLIKHLIERNGILIIAGESMAGKSFLVMDMGMKIARGLDYAGHKTRQGAVIHMAVEDGKGTELRHKGYRKANGISPDTDVPYVIMDPFANGGMSFSLMDDAQVDKFIAECLEWKEYYGSLEFIIIDTLAMATEGMDENSSGEASKVLGRVNRIRERTGATLAVVHHMNAGGTKVRGSTAIVANVPNVIELRQLMTIPQNRREDPKPVLDGSGRPIRRARLAKNKNGVANKGWSFVLEEVSLDERDEDGEPFQTMVCARPSRHSQNDAPEDVTRLQGGNKLVFDALTAAQADHGQDLPQGVDAGSVSKCVSQSAFVAQVRKRMSFKAPEEEQEARQKELADFLSRTTMALINAGFMGRDNDKRIVWWTGKSDRPAPRQQREPPPPIEPPGSGIPPDVKRELQDMDEAPF